MKNKILSSVFVFVSILCGTQTIAQSNSCKVDSYNFPGKEQRILEQEQAISDWVNARLASRNTGQAAIITIPVVVHVVHNGEPVGVGANISDAQIIEQIEILNKDFRALNADSLSPGHPFYNLRGDSRIEFCLAKQDPSGFTTNGITRTLGGQTQWTDTEGAKLKRTQYGGKSNWNPRRYLNVWVFNPAPGNTSIGWSAMPSQMDFFPMLDGVVVQNTAFGIHPNNLPAYNKGRTLAHEVGHWLNLYHLWGLEDEDDDCVTDHVDDTPPSEGPHYGCPSFPSRPNSACGTDANGEMFMNFMDYVNQDCMNMFTEGQALRMEAAINTLRTSLLTSIGCQPSTVINPLVSAARWYVDPAATGDSSATSWANACPSLQQALLNALDFGVSEIWVKKGTYIPTQNGNRDDSFVIPEGVKVYGGFEGTESLLSQRNMALIHTTGASVLSGDLSADDVGFTNNGENSYTVVEFLHSPNTTELDGFVIRGGNNYFPSGAGWGGGIVNTGSCGSSSEPKLSNCLITWNYAYAGGGLYNDAAVLGEANMTISNCIFDNNSSYIQAGALYNNAYEDGTCSPQIINTVFKNNSSGFGGAIVNDGTYNGDCQPVFTGCTFLNNYVVNGNGGAVENNGRGNGDGVYSGLSSPVFVDCIFEGNKAMSNGGTGAALVNDASGGGKSSPVFKNVVFLNNESYWDGPVMYSSSYSGGESIIELTNCSFSGNKPVASGLGAFFNSTGDSSTLVQNFTNCVFFDNGTRAFRGSAAATVNLNYCLTDNSVTGFTGANNIVSGISPFVSASDVHLSNCSPAKNIGNNAASGLTGITTDIEGNNRILEGTIDAGAYEALSAPVVQISETRGKALSFSNNSQHVSTVNLLSDEVSNITLESWIKINSFPSADTLIWYHGNSASNGYGLKLDNTGNLKIIYGGISVQATTHTFQLNTWQHLAFRIDNTAAEIFVNGKSVGTLTGLPNVPAGVFRMGGFSGESDEIRFWENARTQTQIRENMHLIVDGGSSGLKNYFQFNEASPTNLLMDGVGCAKAIVYGAGWVTSQANCSKGTSFTVTNPSTATNYNFAGTNLSLNFGNTPGAGQIVVSRLEGKPTGTQVNATSPFNDFYWVVENFCANTTNLDIDASVTMAAGLLVSADEATPAQVKLNRRAINSGGNWTTVRNADLATVSTNTLVLIGNAELQEFVISNSYNAITLSEDTLNAFTLCAGLVSDEQTYTVSAIDLTANLVITAPAGYEISLTSGSGFSASLNLVPSGGIINNTTIYVRKDASPASGSEAVISHSSSGQLTKQIVIPAAATNQLAISLPNGFNVFTTGTSFNLAFQTLACLPATYSITSISPNPLSGFTAITNAAVSSSPIAIPLPGSMPVGTYNFNLEISNGVSQVSYPFILNVIDGALTERRGKSMYFGGSGQSLTTQAPLSAAIANTTLESWVMAHAVGSSEVTVMHHGTHENGFGVVLSNSRELLFAYDFSRRQSTGYYLPLNTWHHVALTCDGTFIYLYVDGIRVFSTLNSSVPPTGGLVLGGRLDSYLHGQMDEVRFWNVCRTQQQIRESMHLTLPTGTANLKNYYQFNESSAQATAMDVISGINAVVNGGSWVSSSANVSKGVSFTIDSPAAGIDHSFTGTSLQLNFGNPVGTGEVVASRLEGEPAGTQMTSSDAVDQYYWVVDNYAANKTSLNVTAKVTLPGGEVTATNESVPGTMLLNQRDVNAYGSWETATGATSAVSSTGVVTFSANSNIREFVVGKSTLLLPTVSISSNDVDNNVPSGATITFTAVTTNTGDTPTYQWKVNGANAGTNSAVFATNSLQAGDVVSVVFSTSGSGISTLSINSNQITMQVYPFEIRVTASDSTICQGESVTLSAQTFVNNFPAENLWTAKPISFNTGLGVSNNTTWLTKVYVESAITVSELWVDITYRASAATNVKLALYSDAGGSPRNLLKASTPKNNLLVGVNKLPIESVVLAPGAYWVAFICDNSVNFKRNSTLSGNNAAVLFTGYASGFPATTFTSTMPNSAYSFGIVSSGPAFSWSPSGTLNVSIGDTVIAAPTATTTYTVSMTDEYGNIRTNSKQIQVGASSFSTHTVSACGSYLWIDGNTYTSGNNSATHTLTNAAGCDSVVTLNLTISPLPTITSVTPASRCGTGAISLTASASAGNVKWYLAATGGSPVFTGTTLPLSLSATKTYYVEADNGGCVSASRTAVTATIDFCSQIQASQCGTTLTGMTLAIIADAALGATHYRFEITNGANVQTITRTTRTIYPANFSALLSTTYNIRVATSSNGTTFGLYGPSCSITTLTIPSTQVQASQCGSTLATLSTAIIADAVSGATSYRFEITNGATVQTVVKTTRTLYMGNFNYAFNTTYGIRVAATKNGTDFGYYAGSCNITTSPVPPTQVQASQCGSTLATLSTAIIADAVTGGTHYRFQITNGANVQTVTKTTRTLYMGNFTYAYNTTYGIRVAASNDGVNFGAYGASCNITTIPPPPTQVQVSQCNTTLPTVSTAVIADAVTGATHYRFEINGGAQVVTKTTRTLYLGNFTYALGTTYAIRVTTSSDGTNFSVYGTSCNITSPATAMREDENIYETTGDLMADFSVEAYPNPNNGDFVVSSSHAGQFSMVNELGQLIRKIEFSGDEKRVKVENVPPGIYFITGILNREAITRKVIVQ
ncbi:MAG: hypothetical protein K0R65_3070 [Crocinitomicaceae bacterium]|jgi:hypothetical protein|nr:hypothetical protein [Crocinitomicaceae bacterium]